MVRLQQVTFEALNKFLGLRNELISNSTVCLHSLNYLVYHPLFNHLVVYFCLFSRGVVGIVLGTRIYYTCGRRLSHRDDVFICMIARRFIMIKRLILSSYILRVPGWRVPASQALRAGADK